MHSRTSSTPQTDPLLPKKGQVLGPETRSHLNCSSGISGKTTSRIIMEKTKKAPTTCHFTLKAPLEDKGLGQCRWCLGGWWPTAGFLPTGTAHPGAQAAHKYWGEQRSPLLQTALSRGMVCAAKGLCGGDVAELCTGHVDFHCIASSWSQWLQKPHHKGGSGR